MERAMNPRQLEIFDALMRTGSVSSAARLLNLSQPAVTKSLRLAEQATGFLLFRRVRGRLFPSPEAEALLPEVERIRSDMGAISSLIQQLRDGNAGSVSIASVASLAHAFLTPALARFRRQRPNIRLEVSILPSRMVVDQVAHSHADLGLIHDPSESLYVDGEDLCQAEVVCLVPKKHPLAQRRTVSARDLAEHPLISFRDDTPAGWMVRQTLTASGKRRDIDIVVNQSQQAIDLVEAGCGVALIDPFLMIGAARLSLAIVPLRPSIPLRPRIIRARDRPRSRAATQLARDIRAEVTTLTRDSPMPIRAVAR
jgi:DNA-binding transcriptional LysR family regulator